MLDKIRMWLSEEESGQGLVEYALIIALVALSVILAMHALRSKIESRFFSMAFLLG